MRIRRNESVRFLYLALPLTAVVAASVVTEVPVADDPLVRMPGTQPADGVSLEGPRRCMNCHAGYDPQVEPGHTWQGSMMAQAARDPLFYACMAVSAQDSQWAIGRPNAIDLCARCHFPEGWFEGRSEPVNASAMTGSDFDGVSCDLCHRLYDPFFMDTFSGLREGSSWFDYWDETNQSPTPSQSAAEATLHQDQEESLLVKLFNGQRFYEADDRPVSDSYTENASGQMFVAEDDVKRASFADANARHEMYYSRYHKSKFFCGTCHDVSNPALQNLAFDGVQPGDGGTILPTESQSAFGYFHVERTFSEFMLSAFGQQGGAPGTGPFAPDVFDTSLSGNSIARCQDCHMRDHVGSASNKNDALIRPLESIEHPQSGQPVHSLTGGNVFVTQLLASTVPTSPNYDPVNENLLGQGPAVLTLDLTQGEGIAPTAMIDGYERARQQLQDAASIEAVSFNPVNGTLVFRIQNHTGHKLISGFPEGRRMFANIKALSGQILVREINPYSYEAGTLKGLSSDYSPSSPPLNEDEHYVDELVYEMHPSSDITGETQTFHFVLATGRHKDNRIPPQGFDIQHAAERLSEPVWHGVSAPDYFDSDEYASGYDEVALTMPSNADHISVDLFYQTTSREYVEFLKNEISGTGELTLPSEAYVAQTEAFFDGLRGWGDTIWQLWEHNKQTEGVAPFLMTHVDVYPIDRNYLFGDFDYQGPQTGSEPYPFNTLDEALLSLLDGGTLTLEAGSTSETVLLNRPMQITSTGNGVVKIGVQTP